MLWLRACNFSALQYSSVPSCSKQSVKTECPFFGDWSCWHLHVRGINLGSGGPCVCACELLKCGQGRASTDGVSGEAPLALTRLPSLAPAKDFHPWCRWRSSEFQSGLCWRPVTWIWDKLFYWSFPVWELNTLIDLCSSCSDVGGVVLDKLYHMCDLK